MFSPPAPDATTRAAMCGIESSVPELLHLARSYAGRGRVDQAAAVLAATIEQCGAQPTQRAPILRVIYNISSFFRFKVLLRLRASLFPSVGTGGARVQNYRAFAGA